MRGVFDSVAGKYDLMNDLMSGGMHRLWKRFALSQTGLRPGQRALDVASGTGDLGAGIARQVGDKGLAVLTDINREMLSRGRDRLLDQGIAGNVTFVIANAECLPFPDRSVRLRDDRLRFAQCHRQGCGARLDASRAAAGRAPAGARVLASRRSRR